MDDAELAETYLREHARPGQPAALVIAADEPHDPERWAAITAWLQERGWRVAVDDDGELWFYPPGPLSDPGDVARNLN